MNKKSIIWQCKKYLSYLYPITIETKKDYKQRNLKLQLYCGQYLLSTAQAVYSYGTMYAPFRITFKKIKNHIPHIKTMLLLGTGLGSALKILQQKYNSYPQAFLIDIDKEAIYYSMKYMELNHKNNVQWILSDALQYIANSNMQYDLIAVDVFIDTLLPADYKNEAFFKQCYSHLTVNGMCIFNVILSTKSEISKVENALYAVFATVNKYTLGINTFYVCNR